MKVLGTNVDGRYAKVTNEVVSTTAWQTVYEADDTLAPGTETVKTSPYTGYKVQTYHTIYDKDGKVIDSHFEATSDYKVRNKVILRPSAELPGAQVPASGTAAIPVTPTTPEESTPPSVIPAEPPAEEIPQEPIIVIPEAPPEEIIDQAPLIPME